MSATDVTFWSKGKTAQWMAGWLQQSIVFPATDSQLCCCDHDGIHVFAEQEEVARVFQGACEKVLGLCSSIERQS